MVSVEVLEISVTPRNVPLKIISDKRDQEIK